MTDDLVDTKDTSHGTLVGRWVSQRFVRGIYNSTITYVWIDMNYGEDRKRIVMSLEEIMPDAIVLIPFAMLELEPLPSDVLLYPCAHRHNAERISQRSVLS